MNAVGSWLVATASPAANATINIDSVFTSDYRNYKIVIRGTASATTPTYLRWRAGGVTLTDNIFSVSLGNQNTATTVGGASRSDSFGLFPAMYQTFATNVEMIVCNPRVTDHTTYNLQAQFGISATDNGLSLTTGQNKVTTSIDGFSLTTASAPTLSLTYWIYGLKG
jgi:hypothetical protein